MGDLLLIIKFNILTFNIQSIRSIVKRIFMRNKKEVRSQESEFRIKLIKGVNYVLEI